MHVCGLLNHPRSNEQEINAFGDAIQFEISQLNCTHSYEFAPYQVKPVVCLGHYLILTSSSTFRNPEEVLVLSTLYLKTF